VIFFWRLSPGASATEKLSKSVAKPKEQIGRPCHSAQDLLCAPLLDNLLFTVHLDQGNAIGVVAEARSGSKSTVSAPGFARAPSLHQAPIPDYPRTSLASRKHRSGAAATRGMPVVASRPARVVTEAHAGADILIQR
jgi:hypothetical protein